MYKNYEDRVKDFILEMTNPDTKIEIKDISGKINSARRRLYDEKELKKPFIFKGYKTEEDRIKDTIKNNRYLYNLPDYDNIIKSQNNSKQKRAITHGFSSPRKFSNLGNSIEKGNAKSSLYDNTLNLSLEKKKLDNFSINDKRNFKYLIKNDLIMQPQMRFKPRTDLERIYDSLKGYHYDQLEREIIEKQLRNLDLFDYKKPQELFKIRSRDDKPVEIDEKKGYKIVPNDLKEAAEEEENYKKKQESALFKQSKLYYDPKKEISKPWMRKESLNDEARKILKEYHYKIHFKATEEIAANKKNVYINNIIKKVNNSCFLLPNLLPKIRPLKTEEKEKNFTKLIDFGKKDLFIFTEEREDENVVDDYKENDRYSNPLIKRKGGIPEPKSMKILNELAFCSIPKENGDLDSKIEENNYKDKKDWINNNEKNNLERNVQIGNETYNKNKQFNKIADKVLEVCNVYSPKSKFNNTILKARSGKTMITGGLTVEEFDKKFGFSE